VLLSFSKSENHVAHDIMSPLLAEETRLETELKLNPVFRRLEAVRASIRGLREAYGLVAEPPRVDAPKESAGGAAPTRARRPDSITRRVVEIAESAMRLSDKRQTSGQVYDMAIAQGVVISGVKPPSVVASILSHERKFDNRYDDHGSGYGLREWTPEQMRIEELLDDLHGETPPSNEQGSQRETAESP
jgi:hypothetical protein